MSRRRLSPPPPPPRQQGFSFSDVRRRGAPGAAFRSLTSGGAARRALVLAALGAALLFLRPVPAEAQTVTKAYTDRCAGSAFGGPVVLGGSAVTRASVNSGALRSYYFRADPAVAVGSTPAQWFRETSIRTGSTAQGAWGLRFWNQASGGTARDYGSTTTPTSVRVVLIPSTGTGVHWEFTVADAPYGGTNMYNVPSSTTSYLAAAQTTAAAASGATWQVMLLDTAVSGQTWSSNGQFTTLPSWTSSTAGCLPAVLGAPRLANPPAGGYYDTGDTITVELVFSRRVTAPGTTPVVDIRIGAAAEEADCSLGADGVTLSCSYEVQATNEDTDGIDIVGPGTLTGFDGTPSGDPAVTGTYQAASFTATVNHEPAAIGPSTPAPTGSLSRVVGVVVRPIPGGLAVSWSAASGPVSQYRVDAAPLGSASSPDSGVRNLAAGHRRVYTDADVFEAEVDGLVDGVEYQVTVTALGAAPGQEGPVSEAVRRTAGGTSGDPGSEEEPVPALPLAGAAALAAALFAAGRRRHPGERGGR